MALAVRKVPGPADPDLHHLASADARLNERSRSGPGRPAHRQRADRRPIAAGTRCCDTYPELIRAAEGAGHRHRLCRPADAGRRSTQHGYKVALTGEGADEWLAGYPWYKITRLLGLLDVDPGPALSRAASAGVCCADRAAAVPVGMRSHERRQPSAGTTPGSTSTA